MSSFAVSNFNVQVNAQANPEADWEMFIGLSMQASDGKTYTLSKLRGKAVVLAWFPKAFTAG